MLSGRRILLIEDDETMGGSIAQRLALEGAEISWVKQAVRGLGALRTPRAPVDAVICDIGLPDGSGEHLYLTLCHHIAPPPFLFITGRGTIDQAVRLLQAGAADYVTKPFAMQEFLQKLSLVMQPRATLSKAPLLGISPAARRVEQLAAAAAQGCGPVLLRGPRGIGKGLLARRIHRMSDRCAAPFLEVNFARAPDPQEALRVALAAVGEGVVFLNALGSLPAPLLCRLPADLQDVAARLIAACEPDTTMPTDLLHLLDHTEIQIPALKARPEDAGWLLGQMFPKLNARRSEPLKGISALTQEAARAHDWPGNGRELRARLLRAMQSAAGPLLFPSDLFPERASDDLLTLAQAREMAERTHIAAALERAGGQISTAARLLDVSRTTLWEKLQKLGL